MLQRGKVVGSSGMVHLSMNTNISGILINARKACTLPGLMSIKVKHILIEKFKNEQGGKTKAANLFVYYERVRDVMQRRCDFHLQEIVDHMEIWFSPFNDHVQPIVRDHNGDGKSLLGIQSILGIQQDDAKAYLMAQEAEDVVQETSKAPPVVTGGNRRNWKWWFQMYQSGKWPEFPHAKYEDMPKEQDGETVDYNLWTSITRAVAAKIEAVKSVPKVAPEPRFDSSESNFQDYLDLITNHTLNQGYYVEDPNSTSVDPELLILSRPPRQIFFFLTMAAIAIGSLLYSTLEVEDMADTAQQNQDVTIQNLNEMDHRLAIQEKSIKLLNESLALVQEAVAEIDTRLSADEMITEINITLEMFYSEVTRCIRGLSALSRNELSADLVDMKGLTRNLMMLRDRMENRGYILSLNRLEHIFQQPVSYVLFGNGSLWAFAHLSCYRKAAMYTLWEYNEVPFISPTAEGDVALSIRPESALIGISEDDARHILFDHRKIDQCTYVGNLRVCDEANVINTKVRESCLSSLFLKDVNAIKNNCRWHSSPRSEFVQQINGNQFVSYFVEPQLNFKITCSDGNDMVEKRLAVSGAVRITLQGGCRAYSNHHIMEGRLEFSIETSTYQLKPINMTELLSTPYFTITPEKWNTWKKIRVDIGNPDGVLFKDVGPMYQRYAQNKIMGIGLASVTGILVPIVLIILLVYFRKRLFGMCVDFKENLNKDGLARFTSRRRQPPPPDTFSRASPEAGINTPRTAKKILNSMGWTEDQKKEYKSNSELIALAESQPLTGATSKLPSIHVCKKCDVPEIRCRCLKGDH